MKIAAHLLIACVLHCDGAALAAGVEAVDTTGVRVMLPKPAQRIVSLSPHATELIAAAGAGGRLVGVTQACDFPQHVATLPRVASAQGVNIEALIATKPDLVVVWPAGNRAQDIERIRALNIPVFASQPETLAQIATDIEKIGVLSDTLLAAKTAAKAVHTRIGNLDNAKRNRTQPLRVFYQLGPDQLYTLNDQHPVMEVISRCGGRNVFGHLPQAAPHVSVEAVINAKPELIVMADRTQAGFMRAQWREKSAFSGLGSTRFVVADGTLLHRPTPRMLDAAQALCNAIRDNKSAPTLSTRPTQ